MAMKEQRDGLAIAKGERETLHLLPRMANRHGLIAGATGTGKTVTLRVLAEHFSNLGVPVFLADVKGDLSGMLEPGEGSPKVVQRAAELGLDDFAFQGFPVEFWDVFGEKGHPLRATVSDMGPLLMSRLLGLNDTQSGVLTLTFKVADDHGLLLLDLKDLRAMLQFVGDNAARVRTEYGNVSAASIGAIQRALLRLENEGAGLFLGEPVLALEDLMRVDAQGRGVINILSAERLMNSPSMYAACLLWMMAALFEQLPEVGDPPQPKLVFFFDEAHLLFSDLPRVLQDKIEQIIRLIRSKGVGIYFVTQNPLDIPDVILGQLGNRVQHALRAYTPRDQRAVRAAAQTFRINPGLDVERVIGELGVGEALVSLLDDRGIPQPVERALIYPPVSRMAPLDEREVNDAVRRSMLDRYYRESVDRESAYELLANRVAPEPAPQGRAATKKEKGGWSDIATSVVKSATRAAGTQLGRQIIRGILGSLGKR